MAKAMVLDRENLQKLYRYAYALTANEADAYDLLQSAVETSLKNPPDSVNKTLSYIRMIIKNRFIDNYRHRKLFPQEDLDDHSPVSLNESSLEDVVIASHDLERIWKTLDSLDREILFYWAVEGYSMSDISKKLELSRGTLLSRIHRLRKRLTVEENDRQRGSA